MPLAHRLAFLLALTAAVTAPAQTQLPAVFRGRPIAEWVERLQRDATEEGTRQAGLALHALARESDAVATSLLPLLASEDVRIRRSATWLLVHPAAVPALIGALDDADEEVRENATRTLRNLGPAAAAATPRLIRRVHGSHDDFDWQLALFALGAIGKAHADTIPTLVGQLPPEAGDFTPLRQAFEELGADAVPVLMEQLAEPARAPAAAAMLLDFAGRHPIDLDRIERAVPDAPEVVVEIRRQRARRDPAAIPVFVRTYAQHGNEMVDRVGVRMPIDANATDAVLELLADADAKVRRLACTLAEGATAPLPRAVPVLAQRLTDDDDDVRRGAVMALRERAVDAPAACMLPLIEAARSLDSGHDPDWFPGTACLALGTLAATHPGARDALQELTRLDTEVGAYAALALAKNIAQHDQRTQWLQRAMRSTNGYIGRQVQELADADQAPAAADALREAKRILTAADEDITNAQRLDALAMLERIGEHAAPLAALIQRHLGHEDTEVQRAAILAATRVAPRCSELFAPMLALARTRDDDTWAIEALGRFGKAGEPAVPFLIQLLGHHDQDRQRSAALALGALGESADAALVAVLGAGDPGADATDAFYFAIDALVQRGAAAGQLLGSLTRHASATVRGAAIDALGQIADLKAQATSALLQALRDPHWFVRGRAVARLEAIGDTTTDLAPFRRDPDGYVRLAAHHAGLARQRR